MNTAQWPQEIVVKPLEEIVTNPACPKPSSVERKPRPQKDQNLNCPRCNSTNTKFCYYNNYSLTQPRYFCKTCRRYWTEGGTLRNIPVGGGTRKNKRSASSSTSSSALSTPSKKLPDLVNPPLFSQAATQNPKMVHEGQDLNLGFTSSQDLKTMSELVQAPCTITDSTNKNNFPSASTSNTSQVSALELINGIASRGLSSFMPMAVSDSSSVYTPGFSLQEFKPNLNFSLDGFGSGFGNVQGVQESNNGRLLFPFEDLKQGPSTEEGDQGKVQGESSGYWTGMLGGGSW